MRRPATQAVMNALIKKSGEEARFVGGCVRDALIGQQGGDNIDIATSIAPNRVIMLLEAAGLKAIPTGVKHGTITAIVADETFEITTLRRDVDTDGRHATVQFTEDWSIDASRRDFTINAMYCDINGTLYDPLKGASDLKSGVVRFVGNAERRIQEDTLRILRFFRFYAYFGKGPPDPKALDACGAAASKLNSLSGERICSELLRWLTAPDPMPAIKYADEFGVLSSALQFSPSTEAIGRTENLVSIESQTGLVDPLRRLASLTSNPKQRGTVASRLKLSNKSRRRLEAIFVSPFKITRTMSHAEAQTVLYRLGCGHFQDAVLLSWARESGERDPNWQSLLDHANHWHRPTFPVAGEDIIALGIPAGPLVGKALNEVEEWWTSGNFKAGRQKTLDYLSTIVGKFKQ